MTTTRRALVVVAAGLVLAVAILTARLWALPVLGDDWADVLLIGSTLLIAGTAGAALTKPAIARYRGRHRKPHPVTPRRQHP